MEPEKIYSELLPSDPGMAPLIEAFVSDLGACCLQLKTALEQGDVPKIYLLAHRFLGSGGGHGFPAVSGAGAELKLASRDQGGLTPMIREAAARFLDVACRVRPGLKP